MTFINGVEIKFRPITGRLIRHKCYRCGNIVGLTLERGEGRPPDVVCCNAAMTIIEICDPPPGDIRRGNPIAR